MDRSLIVMLVGLVLLTLSRALHADIPQFRNVSPKVRLVATTVLGAAQTVVDAWAIGTPIRAACLSTLATVGPAFVEQIVALASLTEAAPASQVSGVARKGSSVAILCLVLCALACASCARSFEEARIAGRKLAATPLPPSAQCIALDREHRYWTATAEGLAVLSGGAGLTAIPVKGDDARLGLAIGSAVAAAGAAASVALAGGAASSYVELCR